MSASERGDSRRAFFVRVPEELADYIAYLNGRTGCTAQQVIRAALRYLRDSDRTYAQQNETEDNL